MMSSFSATPVSAARRLNRYKLATACSLVAIAASTALMGAPARAADDAQAAQAPSVEEIVVTGRSEEHTSELQSH